MTKGKEPEIRSSRKPFNLFILIVALSVLIYYALVGIWPFLYNIFLSFRRTDLITVNKFVGLKNYKYMINDPVFWKALWHNFFYLGVMVSTGIFTSLIIAVLIYRTRGLMRKVYTAMFFAPVVTSMVAISLVWVLLYFPKIGLFAIVIEDCRENPVCLHRG